MSLAEIQAYYDEGNNVRECQDKFGISAVSRAKRAGLRCRLRRRGRLQTDVECKTCTHPFSIPVARKRSDNFCSEKCWKEFNAMNPFRRLQKSIELRSLAKPNKYGICQIVSVSDLDAMWDRQKGLCPITGWKMILPSFDRSKNERYRFVSIDRLDNSIGYSKENVRLVCLIANLARSTFGDQTLIKFCHAVASRNGEDRESRSSVKRVSSE